MRSMILLLTAWVMLAQPASGIARAAELLMFEEQWCHWCARWHEEVGVVYDRTDEGRRAPLRRIDIHGSFPDDVVLSSRPQYTPTFVLVDTGREIGRIEGYPGEDFFWGLLQRMLERLPPRPVGHESTQSVGTN